MLLPRVRAGREKIVSRETLSQKRIDLDEEHDNGYLVAEEERSWRSSTTFCR
jgi:hypothetical protein